MDSKSYDNEKEIKFLHKRQNYVFEGGLNESQSSAGADDSDMDPEEFAKEMEMEKTKLRKEACRNYIIGALASTLLYALFWVVVTAQNNNNA